jgi:hypothetical protein
MASTPTVPIEQARLFGTTPEREVVQVCLNYLAACRIEAWRVNVAGVSVPATERWEKRYIKPPPRGTPDIAGVLPPSGRALFVECKSRDGRLSPAQVQRQAVLRAQGALVLTVRTLDELREGLRAAGVEAP